MFNRYLCLVLVVLLAAVAMQAEAQTETETSTPESEAPESGDAPQKQRREGANDEDVDIADVDLEDLRESDEESVEFYGSARLVVGSEGDGLEVRDNLSRVGLFAVKDFADDYAIYARVELGVNLVDSLGRILNPKANAPDGANGVIARLGYLGLETPFGQFSFGKQWSAYWPVAAFTDRFSFSGGLAGASFNARTDGGAVGTGRADGALKYTLDVADIDFRFQWQPGERRIPQTEEGQYSYGIGTSVFYEWDSRLSFGAAFNYSPLESLTEELENVGLAGNEQAFLLGAMYKAEPFYFAFNYVQHRNHDTDDLLRYYDAEGFEIYARVTLAKRWRAFGGINYLTPTRRPFGGASNLRFGIIGVERSLFDDTFWHSVYSEFILDESRRSDGTLYPNAFVVGVRLGLEI